MERRQYLERLVMGLEQSIPEQKSRIQYYENGDLEKRYAERFLKSMGESLEKARRELTELERGAEEGGKP